MILESCLALQYSCTAPGPGSWGYHSTQTAYTTVFLNPRPWSTLIHIYIVASSTHEYRYVYNWNRVHDIMCILVTFDPVGLMFSVLSLLFCWSKLISQLLVNSCKKKKKNIHSILHIVGKYYILFKLTWACQNYYANKSFLLVNIFK